MDGSRLQPGFHISPTYLRHSRQLQLTTVDDLFLWAPGAFAMDRWRTQIYAITHQIVAMPTIPPVNKYESNRLTGVL